MQQEREDAERREAAYRRGWTQGADETARLILQLVEMGYKPTEIRRLLAAYSDHMLMVWRQEGDLSKPEAAPDFQIEAVQEIVKRGGYDWMV